jgi:6-phosphogluconolactonase (cycloisomerase 2 family)
MAAGELTPLSPASVTAGKNTAGMLATPDGLNLYVADRTAGTISQFSIGADGKLTALSPATIASGLEPYAIVCTPDGKYLYCENVGSEYVSKYVRKSDGTLEAAGTQSRSKTGGWGIGITQDGKDLYVPYEAPSAENEYKIESNGSLVANGSFEQAGAPFRFCSSGDSSHMYVSAWTGNAILVYSRNAEGKLALVERIEPGHKIGAFAKLSPDEKFLLQCYWEEPEAGKVIRWVVKSNGTLESPTVVATLGAKDAYDIQFTPDAKFVYVSCLGDNKIYQFSYNTATGALTALTTPTVGPQASLHEIVISPDGRFLYASTETETIYQFATNISVAGLLAMIV